MDSLGDERFDSFGPVADLLGTVDLWSELSATLGVHVLEQVHEGQATCYRVWAVATTRDGDGVAVATCRGCVETVVRVGVEWTGRWAGSRFELIPVDAGEVPAGFAEAVRL